MYCKYCRKQIADDFSFCQYCGGVIMVESLSHESSTVLFANSGNESEESASEMVFVVKKTNPIQVEVLKNIKTIVFYHSQLDCWELKDGRCCFVHIPCLYDGICTY